VHAHPYPSQAAPLRLLVAADTSIDPHRLAKLCSDHAGGGAPSVLLLVPVDLESRRSSRSAARAERLLRAAISLLDAARIRLEDIAAVDNVDALGQIVRSGGFDALLVCPARCKQSSPVLALAARLGPLHGLTVDGDTRQRAGQASWLRRIVNPLLSSPSDP
jgi:hypothetical protein